MSWASRLAATLAAVTVTVAALAGTSCSATPILKVDEELPVIDLESCVAGTPPCVRQGTVVPFSILLPDGQHELALLPGGSIEGPLNQPSKPGRLAYLALGLNVDAPPPGSSDVTALEVSIVGDDTSKVIVQPSPGLRRIELDMREYAPKPGARLRLRCVSGGALYFTYAIGRWFYGQ